MLRAERYNSKAAAARMVRFFSFKEMLFGEEKLVKDIHLEDLNESDLMALRSGYCQMFPERDRSGRPVLLVHGRENTAYHETMSLVSEL